MHWTVFSAVCINAWIVLHLQRYMLWYEKWEETWRSGLIQRKALCRLECCAFFAMKFLVCEWKIRTHGFHLSWKSCIMFFGIWCLEHYCLLHRDLLARNWNDYIYIIHIIWSNCICSELWWDLLTEKVHKWKLFYEWYCHTHSIECLKKKPPSLCASLSCLKSIS